MIDTCTMFINKDSHPIGKIMTIIQFSAQVLEKKENYYNKETKSRDANFCCFAVLNYETPPYCNVLFIKIKQ